MLFVNNVEKERDMVLTAKVNRHQHIEQYLNIFNGVLGMTVKETEFLHEILFQYLTMIDDGIKEPYLGQLAFSKESIAHIKEKLSLSNSGVNNYKTQLIKKKVFLETATGSQVDPRLIPQTKLEFNFILHE